MKEKINTDPANDKPQTAEIFGKVEADEWGGYFSEKKFYIPYFEKKINVFLGSEYDEEGEEIDMPPTENDLLEYAKTFKSFIENIDNLTDNIKEKAFERYQRIYAKAYEAEFPCGQYPLDSKIFPENEKESEMHKPLNINDKETHFEYMKHLLDNRIRIVKGSRIVIPIHYKLDVEHAMEILLKDNQVQKIDGMGETYYWQNET